METWKPITGFANYEISNLGRVKSLPRSKTNYVEYIMNPLLSTSGYLIVRLYRRKCYSKMIHRLIAEYFIPNPDHLPVVNHINGIKTDNRIENLEWCTSLHNGNHASKMGLISRGSDHYRNILTEEQIRRIRTLYVPYKYTQRMLAKEFGVTRTCIEDIVHGNTWKWLV